MTRIYWPVTKADGPVQCTMQHASSRASAWHTHFRMQNQNCYKWKERGHRMHPLSLPVVQGSSASELNSHRLV